MKIKIGVIMLAIAALMMLSVGLISAGAHNTISGTVIDGTDRTPIEGRRW